MPHRLIEREWWQHVRRDYLSPKSWVLWVVIVGLFMIGSVPVAILYNQEQGDARRQQQMEVNDQLAEFNRRLCETLPRIAASSAASGARALQDVVAEADRAEGDEEGRRRVLVLGALLQVRARAIAREDAIALLEPQCPR